MPTVQRTNDRLLVWMEPGEILSLPVRQAPVQLGMNTMLIRAAWELVKLYRPDKLDGLALDKATVQFIDGRFGVCFYQQGAV